MTDRRTDGRTDRRTDRRPGKNNMSPNPSRGRHNLAKLVFVLAEGPDIRIEQSGVASSTEVPPNLKQRESVKLKGSV